MPPRSATGDPGIRLDTFLKNSGILKRRSLAQTFCEAGAVLVNGHPAKSGKLIQPGDRILVESWNRHLLVLVQSIPKKGGRQGGESYEVLKDERKSPEDFSFEEGPAR